MFLSWKYSVFLLEWELCKVSKGNYHPVLPGFVTDSDPVSTLMWRVPWNQSSCCHVIPKWIRCCLCFGAWQEADACRACGSCVAGGRGTASGAASCPEVSSAVCGRLIWASFFLSCRAILPGCFTSSITSRHLLETPFASILICRRCTRSARGNRRLLSRFSPFKI